MPPFLPLSSTPPVHVHEEALTSSIPVARRLLSVALQAQDVILDAAAYPLAARHQAQRAGEQASAGARHGTFAWPLPIASRTIGAVPLRGWLNNMTCWKHATRPAWTDKAPSAVPPQTCQAQVPKTDTCARRPDRSALSSRARWTARKSRYLETADVQKDGRRQATVKGDDESAFLS